MFISTATNIPDYLDQLGVITCNQQYYQNTNWTFDVDSIWEMLAKKAKSCNATHLYGCKLEVTHISGATLNVTAYGTACRDTRN